MKTALFPAEGTAAVNVKFFLGTDRSVTAEQLADQLDRADAQIRSQPGLRSATLDGHLAVKAI
jgi:hypothetical protein